MYKEKEFRKIKCDAKGGKVILVEYMDVWRKTMKEVALAQQKAYEELYDRLDSKEGEKDLYRLERRDRTVEDTQ